MNRGTSRRRFLLLACTATMVGCAPTASTQTSTSSMTNATNAAPPPAPTRVPSATPSPVPPTATSTPVPVVPTATPTPIPQPTATATPVPVQQAYVPILCYHNFDNYANEYSVRPPLFQAQMKAIKDAGFTSIQLHQVADLFEKGTPLPKKPIAITFDDGRATQKPEITFLRDLGFTATLFIPSGWHELSVSYVQDLDKNGFEIGSHTVWHANLAKTPDKRPEIGEGKATLEKWLGHPVVGFAYPFGTYRQADIAEIHRVGFKYAVTIRQGVELRREMPYRWPRNIITDFDEPDALVKRLEGMIEDAQAGKEKPPPDQVLE